MALSNRALQNILRMILKSEHYRKVIIEQITDEFFQFTIGYFKDIVSAKLDGEEIDADWYKKYFLTGRFKPEETVVYAGLNQKTVNNIYGSFARNMVFDITSDYYDEFIDKVDSLVSGDFSDLEISLTIKYNRVSVELTLSETLIVVNTLGAKRLQIRGGAWSSLGKNLELPLMLTLAKLYQVPAKHYAGKGLSDEGRDVDFHFIDSAGNRYFCEVKLMGKGNPESADAAIARDTSIFIADTLSSLNKRQLTQRGRHWVELRADEGYRKIFEVFTELGIPCVEFDSDLDQSLGTVIPEVFDEIEMNSID